MARLRRSYTGHYMPAITMSYAPRDQNATFTMNVHTGWAKKGI